jgi:1-acyl-sn-glycerol-3-phosphate acyltransferase
LKPFKLGAFTLALERRVPLVPIVLAGTAQALPKRGFVLRGRSAIRVRVLDAIPYAEFATKSAADLADLVRARMKTVLEAKSANAA